MLTDVALILFPVHVIVTLQMSTSKKITILTFFGARSLYVSRPRRSQLCFPPPSYGLTLLQ
jgi:hypothetical protein